MGGPPGTWSTTVRGAPPWSTTITCPVRSGNQSWKSQNHSCPSRQRGTSGNTRPSSTTRGAWPRAVPLISDRPPSVVPPGCLSSGVSKPRSRDRHDAERMIGAPAGHRSEAEATGDGVFPDPGGAGVAANHLERGPAASLHQLLVGGDRAGLDRGAGAQAVAAVPDRRLQAGPSGGALDRAVHGQVGEARGVLDRGGGVVAGAGARVDRPERGPLVQAGGRPPREPRPDRAGLGM